MRLGVVAVALTATVGVVPERGAPAPVVAVAPARFVTGWIPNWSTSVVTDGLRALDQPVVAEVSPFGFSATGATTIATSGTEANLQRSVQALRARGLPVIPSITDGTGRLVMRDILADPVTRTQHVQAIVGLVVSRGYDGIDLDYEGFAFTDPSSARPSIAAAWGAFVQELGPALEAQGKLLSVTVPPIWTDNGGLRGYTWYNWPAIIPHADRFRLMVYDWSVSQPGPIAPMWWVDNVIAYVASVVPPSERSKVQIGVPAYGRNWARVTAGRCPAGADLTTYSVQMENAASLAASRGASLQRDPAGSGELRFTYSQTLTGSATGPIVPPAYVPPDVAIDTIDATAVAGTGTSGLRPATRLIRDTTTCTIERTVFVPDVFSVVQRANATIAAGFGGIAIWALGYESTPELFGPLAGLDVAYRRSGTTVAGNLDAATLIGDGAAGVSVAGWAMDPEFDLPIPVRVTVQNPGQPVQTSGWVTARDVRPDLVGFGNGDARLSVTHGATFGASIPTVAGAQVCLQARGFGADTSVVTVGCVAAAAAS
jgi:hypothetical protein